MFRYLKSKQMSDQVNPPETVTNQTLSHQIELITQENDNLITKNSRQKEQIEKLQSTLSSKNEMISNFVFTEIDTKLKTMVEVKSNYLNNVLKSLTETECENMLNRVDEKGDTFLQRIIRISRANGCDDLEDYEVFHTENYYSYPNRFEGNYHELIETLLKHGASPDIKTKDGKTCLHLATDHKYTFDDYYYFRNPVIIKLLLKFGADTELRDDNTGNTAFHNALGSFSEKIINLFIDHGADINALTKGGKTVIQLASVIPARDIFGHETIPDMRKKEVKNRCKMIIALWENGADASILDKNGDSLLHNLCAQEYLGFGLSKTGKTGTKFLKLLKKHKLQNVKNSAGDTPIFCALNFMRKDLYQNQYGEQQDTSETEENEILLTMKFLTENGANLNVVNNYGYSPLLLAVLRNFNKVKDYLVANGAVLFPRPKKRLTRSTVKQNACNVINTNIEKKAEKRLAEIIADLFFGGESCEYLKSLKKSYRGRFVRRCICRGTEYWFKNHMCNDCSFRNGAVVRRHVKKATNSRT